MTNPIFDPIRVALDNAEKQTNSLIADMQRRIDDLSRPATSFKLRDATRFPDKPDLSRYGLSRIYVVYRGNFWPSGTSVTNSTMPDLDHIANVLIPKLDTLNLNEFMLDIELYNLNTTPANQTRYIKMIDVFRKLRPNWKISLYGDVPARNALAFIGDPARRAARMTAWQSINDTLAPLVAAVDDLYPSCYLSLGETTDITNPVDQVAYIAGQLIEARRIAPRKKISAVLWPSFEGHTQMYDGPTMRRCLDTAFKHADGATIWSLASGSPNFNPEAAWFKDGLLPFIAENKITI